MEFIATHWWLWLVGMIVFGVYPFINQINRMKNMTRKVMLEKDPEGVVQSFFKGLIPMMISSLLSGLCGLLFFVSIVINIIIYTKTVN